MSTPVAQVADVLGVYEPEGKSMSPIHLIGLIEQGLPVTALERVSKAVAPFDANFKYRIVSRATLARRRKPGMKRLLVDESDRLVRLAKVWTFAKEVWGGETPARDFLFRDHGLLEGRRPVDMILASELGAELVTDILGRLKYGTAA